MCTGCGNALWNKILKCVKFGTNSSHFQIFLKCVESVHHHYFNTLWKKNTYETKLLEFCLSSVAGNERGWKIDIWSVRVLEYFFKLIFSALQVNIKISYMGTHEKPFKKSLYTCSNFIIVTVSIYKGPIHGLNNLACGHA